jgi:hypothetical protein
MYCAACHTDLPGNDFRASRTMGDCHPLCPDCAQTLGSCPAPSRQTLIRLIYASGRSISSCQACGSNEGLEFHYLRPLAAGGGAESSNLLLLCRDCHDKVHQGAHIIGRAVGILKRKKNGDETGE